MMMASTSSYEEVSSSSAQGHLNRSRTNRLILLAALCLFGVLAAEEWLSIQHLSITIDEGAHTYAGYEHWKARDFGVNPEHPPLVKLVAALPLLNMNLEQPHPPRFWFMVEQYAGGSQLYTQNDGELILKRARRAASCFTFLLAVLLFAAGWEMFGPVAALIALAVFTFEPTVLAHGALVTTDMGVACFLFASFYAFYRFLKQPGLVRLIVCGLAVGMALAAKVSGVIALPILVVLALVDLAFVQSGRVRRAGILLLSLLTVFVIGFVVLWSFYTFRYAARPDGLAIAPTLTKMAQMIPNGWQGELIKKLAAWKLLPEGYLYAWAKLQSNVVGFSGFLFGRLYPNGTWRYFPVAFVVKSSLSLLLLLGVALFTSRRYDNVVRVPLIGLALSFCAILLCSMSSHLNIGVRHELALYPFAAVIAGAGAWAFARSSRVGVAVVAALLIFQCVSSLRSYPDYLPYSNEAFGGPSKSYLSLSDSNVDWGQQLKEVAEYVRSHNIGECWFANSNMAVAPDKVPCKPLPTGLALVAGQPQSPVPEHISGTVLVSATDAAGVIWGPGGLNPYQQFQQGHPAEMIGNSVLVYRGDFDTPLIAGESHMSQVPLLIRMHKTDAALAEANTAISLDPKSPMLEARLGGALLQLGRIAEAREAFGRAMQKAKAKDAGDEAQAVANAIAGMSKPPF